MVGARGFTRPIPGTRPSGSPCCARLVQNRSRRFCELLSSVQLLVSIIIKKATARVAIFMMVGARGFEPPTPSSRTKCATRLRHAPTEGGYFNESRRVLEVNPSPASDPVNSLTKKSQARGPGFSSRFLKIRSGSSDQCESPKEKRRRCAILRDRHPGRPA